MKITFNVKLKTLNVKLKKTQSNTSTAVLMHKVNIRVMIGGRDISVNLLGGDTYLYTYIHVT